MSKFCGNCGSMMDDSAMVCGNCGAPLETPAENGDGFNPENGFQPTVPKLSPEQKEKVKKIAKKAAIPVAVLVAVVIAICAIVPNVGYKGVIKKFMKAYENQESEAIYEMYATIWDDVYSTKLEDASDDSDEELEDYQEEKGKEIENKLDSAADYLDEEFDDETYKLSYEVTKCKDLSESKIKGYAEQLAYEAGKSQGDEDEEDEFDEAVDEYVGKLGKMKEVTIKVTAKAGSQKEKLVVTLILTKGSNGWEIYTFYIDD